jgi:hypothetical protein
VPAKLYRIVSKTSEHPNGRLLASERGRMPFSKLDPEKFTLDAVKAMQAAFDEVCQRLSLTPEDPRRSKLATVIIELATDGEQDFVVKAEAALATPSVRRPSLLPLLRSHAP